MDSDNKKVVSIGTFKFGLLYSEQEINKRLDQLSLEIDQTFTNILAQQPDAKFLALGVLNGAFMFTSQIVKRLKNPVAIDFIKISSYKGMQSGELSIDSKIDKQLFKNAHVLILDDICDTGKTLAQLTQYVKGLETKSIRIGVLVIRPDKAHQIQPDFIGLKCSGFIIGYGLDYNYQGRQYPEIYQKID